MLLPVVLKTVSDGTLVPVTGLAVLFHGRFFFLQFEKLFTYSTVKLEKEYLM